MTSFRPRAGSRRALIALGSNMGDSAAELRAARDVLAVRGEILHVSTIFETVAWGAPEAAVSRPYLNQLLDLTSTDLPWELHGACKSHEAARGRDSAAAVNAARVIDVDVLVVEHVHMRSAFCTLPHPRLWRRHFLHGVYETLPSRDFWRDLLMACGFWDGASSR